MKDKKLFDEIEEKIISYDISNGKILKGIDDPVRRGVLIRQIVDSIKRVKYVTTICARDISNSRIDPTKEEFDPIRAACWYKRNGNIDEAMWLTFLLTHFGKHKIYNWGLMKGLYGSLDNGNIWTWNQVVNNHDSFINWYRTNEMQLASRGKFSNHRKYQTLSSNSHSGTLSTIESYINLIGNSHLDYINGIEYEIKANPKRFFNFLYKEANTILGFGRLAKFDFLSMVGKISILDIEPDSPYLKGSSGPIAGAKLLYDIFEVDTADLERFLIDLGNYLEIPFAMQILEDSLCNWQKSPSNYIYFVG